MTSSSRRQFIHNSCRLGALAAAGGATGWSDSTARIAQLLSPPPDDPFSGGRILDILRFNSASSVRLETRVGRGLSGRYNIDLARLNDDAMVISQNRFYVRTAAPSRLDLSEPWSVRVRGLVERSVEIPIELFEKRSTPRGVHLLECSGNAGSFGLISAAEWDGVSVSDILKTLSPTHKNARVLISGFDEHTGKTRGSSQGASWIFTQEQLKHTGAFFATRMNGQRLSPDHGQPIRLVVPGWYGCTCIKWVDEIRFVGDDERATGQMLEFSGRTLQRGTPKLATDFRPAEIDLAALPVRIERWRVDHAILYRIVGILWGGEQTTDQLAIRFSREKGDRFKSVGSAAVDHCEHTSNNTWTLWWHAWKPSVKGKYRITMHVNDPTIRTRRLDREYYARTINITDI